jgi:DNA topoisomerase-1
VLNFHGLKPEQHFTQPPPRFSEASLIKELEEQGIGRPSTYVPIISTIQDRGYVDQEQRRFVPTWLGETINEVMNKHFPDIVDTNFTADMERKLDEVEGGHYSWIEFLRNFYGDFKATMEKAEAEMNRVEKPLEELDETCPDCNRNLVIRTGRFGRFVSCSGFPECRYRRSFMNKTGTLCPVCHGDLVERKTRQKKRVFYGCGNYPTCNFAMWEKPAPDPCPNCGGLMVIPKVGQDPVCYTEVIVAQKNTEARPVQEDEKKITRKKGVTDGERTSSLVTKRSPVRRRTATSVETVAAGDETLESVSSSRSATNSQKVSTRTAKEVKATKRTTSTSSTAKKTTSKRTRIAKKASSAVTARTKATK